MFHSYREALDQRVTPGLREGKATRSVAIANIFIRLLLFLLSVNCVCHVLQGGKGALGDPGLPGPTGIRGQFGDRVSWTCMIT